MFKVDFFKILSGNIMGSILNFFNMLLLPPLFLHHLGEGNYALWIYTLSIASVFSFFNFGLSIYSINKLQILFIKRRVLFNTVKNKLISGFIFINLVGLLTIIPLILLFTGDKILLMLMSIFIILANIKGIFVNLFRSYKRHHIGIYINNTYSLLLIIITITVIFYDYGYYTLISSMIFLVLLTIALSILLLIKIMKFNFHINFDIKYIILTLKRSSKFLSFDVSNYLKLQVPIITIQYFLNPFSLILYTLHRTLSNAQYQIVMILNNSLYQDIAKNFSLGSFDELRKIFLFQKKIILFIASVSSMLIYIWYQSIMEFWISDKFIDFLDIKILSIFLLSTILSSLWNGSTVFLSAINKHEKMSVYIIYYGISISILSTIALGFFGLYGLIYSLLFCELIFSFFIQRHVALFLGIPLISLIKVHFEMLVFLLIFVMILIIFDNKFYQSFLSLGFVSFLTYTTFDKQDVVLIKNFFQVN
jgi:O-antigen/teichoic acid export membrane protein